MQPSTGVTRWLWRLTALLQIVLPPFLTVVDAQLERDAGSARALSHVESKTGKDCPPVHALDCALCQHLASRLAKPSKDRLPAALVRLELATQDDGPAVIAAALDRPSLPRAPPNI